MKASNPRISLYKEAMSLEQKREVLQSQLDEILGRLARVKTELFSGEGFASGSSTAQSGMVRKGVRSGRGELKAKILQALVAAGKAGVRVRDLAETLGVKVANVHAWFQAAQKRISGLKKTGVARYSLEGAVSEKDLAGPKARLSKRTGRKSGRSSTPLGRRGGLAAQIISALESAGSQGVKVNDLAKKLNVPPKNLFIWFATTGKRNRAIKKVAPAHYRLES